MGAAAVFGVGQRTEVEHCYVPEAVAQCAGSADLLRRLAHDVDFTDTTVSIGAGADVVWDVLTHDTDALFMGARVDTDWAVGHPITFEGDWDGNQYRDHGTVQAVDRGTLLQFTQFSSMSGKDDVPENYDLLSIALSSQADTTDVTMRLAKPAGVSPPSETEQVGLTENLQAIFGVLKVRSEAR